MALNPLTGAQWIAIQTRVAGEKIADASLRQLGLATLLPLLRRNSRGWRARKNPVKALFPAWTLQPNCAQQRMHVVWSVW
jgi:hypothetical protein